MSKFVETRKCPYCGKSQMVTMSDEQYNQFMDPDGPLVQNIFPDWNADQREALLTGTHAECWDKLFADVEAEAGT